MSLGCALAAAPGCCVARGCIDAGRQSGSSDLGSSLPGGPPSPHMALGPGERKKHRIRN